MVARLLQQEGRIRNSRKSKQRAGMGAVCSELNIRALEERRGAWLVGTDYLMG